MVRRLFLHSVLIALLALCLLPVSSVQAQQGSDVSGALPQSDVSGALAQGENPLVDAEIVQSRLTDAAGGLVRALERGAFTSGGEGEPLSVSPRVTTLLVENGSPAGNRAQEWFVQTLTARGMPDARAQSLSQAVSGLLSDRKVDPSQFLQALHAYNEAVEAAPEAFHDHPPEEVVLVRGALTTLLQAASG